MINEAPNRRRGLRGALLAAAMLPLALCACAAAQPRDYPTFAQIPNTPGDLRRPADWKRDIGAMQAAAAKLQADSAPSTFSLDDTEAFAARQRALTARGGSAPDETAGRAQADAFARTARQRATAPPSTH